MPRTLNRLHTLLALPASALLTALAASSLAPVLLPAPALAQSTPAATDQAALDTIVFRTGRTVRGNILSETETEIKVRVVGPGGLTAETTFPKADILKIERAAKTDPSKPDATKPDQTKPTATPADPASILRRDDKPTGKGPGLGQPDAQTVYILNFTGEFGRDISRTPLRRMLEEAKRMSPDVLVFRFDHSFKLFGEERTDFQPDPRAAFGQLETVRELSTIILDEIRDDPEWAKKPRMVAWVKRAVGGSAFLPFIFPEIYYTSNARHGGIGYLDRMFSGVGDKVVQEKQYSLLLGRAEGLAIRGGHNPQIIRAMARTDFVLSYDFVGGRPVFKEDMSGQFLLTDDADQSAGRLDTLEDVVRFRGNDVLTLDAETAKRLGLSKATVDTEDQLMFELGLERNYVILENRARETVRRWGEEVTSAESNFYRLWRDFERTQVQGDYRERTAARGSRIRTLREIQSMLDKYREAINPRAIQGAPDNWDVRLSIMINELQLQQRLDRPE